HKPTEREGLPPGYRMRADAHYVDQLSARSHDVPLRLVNTDEIDAPDLAAAGDAAAPQALTQSLAAVGLVQPLLVRREGTRYRWIAGRKRLLAARAARLPRVPCLVHNADDAQAAMLARAADVRGQLPTSDTRGEHSRGDDDLHAHLAGAIATIQS